MIPSQPGTMTNVDPTQTQLATRFASVRGQLASAAERCGRAANEVKLIAISKTHPASAVSQLIELGATDIGENRVQEAEGKIIEVGRHKVQRHLVGHLQANKARRPASLFD